MAIDLQPARETRHSSETGTAVGWWSRPCGGRDVFWLALPLVISMSSWTIMNFTDRMFLLWHDELSMAAAMPAGMLHFALICFPWASRRSSIHLSHNIKGRAIRSASGWPYGKGARIGLLCVPLFLALIPAAPWLFRIAGHSPELAAQETLYFQVCLFGAGAEIIAAAMSAFFTGLRKNHVVMIVDTLAAALNLVLDYGWIFGHYGLPALGIEGAAWATVTSLWFRVFAYGALMMLPRYRRPYRLWTGRRFNGPLMRRLLRYGGPNGLQMLVEIAGFTLFLLLMGNLGEEAMAATTLAFNVNTLAFVPMLGLGIALSTIVGQQLGHNRPDLATRATWTSLGMAMFYMGVMALIYVLLPDALLAGHAWGTSQAAFAPLRDLTVVLLRFVAVYCLFDAMNVVFAAVLKGAGDTRFILYTSVI